MVSASCFTLQTPGPVMAPPDPTPICTFLCLCALRHLPSEAGEIRVEFLHPRRKLPSDRQGIEPTEVCKRVHVSVLENFLSRGSLVVGIQSASRGTMQRQHAPYRGWV